MPVHVNHISNLSIWGKVIYYLRNFVNAFPICFMTYYIMYTLSSDILHKNSDSWYIETDTNVDHIQNLSIKCT